MAVSSPAMRQVTLMNSEVMQMVMQRLSHQLIEGHKDFGNSLIMGIQPRGVILASEIVRNLSVLLSHDIAHGTIDPTFYRDDFRRHEGPLLARPTNVPVSLEGRKVILIDDVLYTGRTIRAALDALMELGRPASVELLVLIDRRFSRELPIQPDYVGKSIDSYEDQRVKVIWKEGNSKVQLITA